MTNGISAIGMESLDELLKQRQASQAASTTSVTSTTSTTSTTTDLQTRIANDQKEIDDASKLQTKNDKTIEELEKEVEELQAQIVKNMEQALNDGKTFSDEQQTNINNAVTQTVAAYLNGEITKDKLMETMATKLSASDSEMGKKLNELIEGNDTIVSTIQGKISQICDLASQNDELATKIKNKSKDIATAQAESSSSSCCDPIGFEQDDATYDFIVDRDNDGTFDGQNEFLGAQNGFDEMKALDKDGNGVVEGEELNSVKMIKTDKKTNTQSFVTAQEAGVTSIDLASYQAKNQQLANGNTLAGNYNVNVNGKEVQGYQTLDKTTWLSQNYGNVYGKSMNSDTEYATKTTSSVANTANEVAAQVTNSKHIGMQDVKNLNSDTENALIADTTDSIDNTLNETVEEYTQSYNTTVNDLSDKKDNKTDGTKDDKSANKLSTMNFMTMAYSMQAEAMKKKQAVA